MKTNKTIKYLWTDHRPTIQDMQSALNEYKQNAGHYNPIIGDIIWTGLIQAIHRANNNH